MRPRITPYAFPGNDALERTLVVALHSVSLGLLTTLILVWWLGRLKRHAVFVQLLVTFAINDIIGIFAAQEHLAPSWTFCLFSFAFTVSGTALISVSVLNLVLLTWSLLRFRSGGKVMSDKYFQPLLVYLPWVVALAVFIVAIVTTMLPYGQQHLQAQIFWCWADTGATLALRALPLIPIVCSNVFLVWTLVLTIQSWSSLRASMDEQEAEAHDLPRPTSSMPRRIHRVNLHFTIRVLLFGLAVLVATVVTFAGFGFPHANFPGEFQSSIGVVAALTFGTQADVLRALRHPALLFSRVPSWVSCLPSTRDPAGTPDKARPTSMPSAPAPAASAAVLARKSSDAMSFSSMFAPEDGSSGPRGAEGPAGLPSLRRWSSGSRVDPLGPEVEMERTGAGRDRKEAFSPALLYLPPFATHASDGSSSSAGLADLKPPL